MMRYESGPCTFVYFKDLLRCFLTCVLHMQVTMLWGMFHLMCTTRLDDDGYFILIVIRYFNLYLMNAYSDDISCVSSWYCLR